MPALSASGWFVVGQRRAMALRLTRPTAAPVSVALWVALLGIVAGCSSDPDTQRLEALEQDPMASYTAPGATEVGRRTDAGESFLGEDGAEVELLFDTTRSIREVAAAYLDAAGRSDWALTVQCPTDGILLTGTKPFDGFDGYLTVVVQPSGIAVTLTAHEPASEVPDTSSSVREPTCIGGTTP